MLPKRADVLVVLLTAACLTLLSRVSAENNQNVVEDDPEGVEAVMESPPVLFRNVRSVNDDDVESLGPKGPLGLKRMRRRRKRLRRPSPPRYATRKRVRVDRRRRFRPAVANETEESVALQDERSRDGRFFSLFTVVRFANDPCPTSSGDNGTCYNSADCSERGGVSDGTCASGFGVCCRFQFECGASTSENGTYFNGPTNPERICNLMLSRLNDDICQVRLELDTFDLAPPNDVGECETDFFLVTGGTSVPQLCGINSGQHLIYSVTSNSGPTMLSVVMDTTVTTTATRQWSIRIYQYECSSRDLAPVGCLQYFTAESGDIISFNFRTEAAAGNGPNHLANLNYAACVRVANGYCGIRYSQSSTDPYSFTLSNDASGTLTFPLPSGGVMYGDADCATDYVVIPGGSGDGALNTFSRDRFCGITLGACVAMTTGATTCAPSAMAVTSNVQPFVLTVVTNADETGGAGAGATADQANRGFFLNYVQTPCLSGR